MKITSCWCSLETNQLWLSYILLLVFSPQQTQEAFTQTHVTHWPKQTVDSKSLSAQRESQTHFVKRANM